MMKMKLNKKIAGASAMLLLSTTMLGTSTYAWFTMNKTVEVTGMQLKAHAEEGLLINEVAAAADTHWDEKALAGDGASEYVQLRPASTYNLTDWWHANSLNAYSEAGYGTSGIDADNTAKIGTTDNYYLPISGSGNIQTDTRSATAGSVAERTIYYKDASFGSTADSCEPGEGFYVNYKYYIKSSSEQDMTVAKDKFLVTATATKENVQEAKDLDKAIRVAVKIDSDILIFAPTGGDTSYSVTKNAAGNQFQAVTALATETAIGSTGNITIPKLEGDDTNHEGKLVDVYVWFEGEDQNCKSSNLTETLNDYQIDLKFRIDGIY